MCKTALSRTQVEYVGEDGRGDHEPGVDGAADDPAERVPGAVVEPVVEGVEALLGEEARRAVVEVGVELVDHGLVAQHGEEADGEGQDGAAVFYSGIIRFMKQLSPMFLYFQYKRDLLLFSVLKRSKISILYCTVLTEQKYS